MAIEIVDLPIENDVWYLVGGLEQNYGKSQFLMGKSTINGLEHGCIMTFDSVGNVIIPTDELHYFSEG